MLHKAFRGAGPAADQRCVLNMNKGSAAGVIVTNHASIFRKNDGKYHNIVLPNFAVNVQAAMLKGSSLKVRFDRKILFYSMLSFII